MKRNTAKKPGGPAPAAKSARYGVHYALKAVRRACGMNQVAFARRLGIAWRTLVAIEVGQREVTDGLLDRLLIEFGVLPETLRNRFFDPPLAVTGEEYSRRFWMEWRRKVDPDDSGKSVMSHLDHEMIAKAQLHLEWFMRMAGQRNRLLPALFLFERWLEERVGAFGLKRTWANKKAEVRHSAPLATPLDGHPLFELRQGLFFRYGRSKAADVAPRELSPGMQKVMKAFKRQGVKRLDGTQH